MLNAFLSFVLLFVTSYIPNQNIDKTLKNKNSINLLIGEKAYINTYNQIPNVFENEDFRIKTHLNYVEKNLREKTNLISNQNLKNKRLKMLNLLREYIAIGEFPKNHEFPNERKSVFLDKEGNICAVGYLVKQTAGMSLVNEINSKYKFSSIFEMKNNNLLNWAKNSGLSLDELQMIQPTYCFQDPNPDLCNFKRGFWESIAFLGVLSLFVLFIGAILGLIIAFEYIFDTRSNNKKTMSYKSLYNQIIQINNQNKFKLNGSGLSYNLLDF